MFYKLNKKERKRIEQQKKLETFVQDHDHYEEKRIGEEIWIKMYNGNSKKWQVNIYSKDSYLRYKGIYENSTDSNP